MLLGTLLGVMTWGMAVQAAEAATADTQAILYTNAETELLSSADAEGVVLDKEAMPDNVPILVTGITDNGYFRVDLDGTYYIGRNGLQEMPGEGAASDTSAAANAAIPAELAALRVVTSLDDIFVLGVETDTDSTIFGEMLDNIEAGKYEKIRYIASNGAQFCMWNVSVMDARGGDISYVWEVAPITDAKFSDGYNFSGVFGRTAEKAAESNGTVSCW